MTDAEATTTRVVAAFDFDGTLSTRDNVLPYLRLVCGNVAVARALALAGPDLLASRRDPSRRDAAKATVLRELLAGRREDHLRDLGARFARLVVARHLRPDVVALLEEHRRDGHELVLVSASLDLYLAPVAARLGVTHVIATTLAVDERGRLTGELAAPNVRGAEKVRRLDAHLADAASPAFVHAYGDSAGDNELLARADRPVRVPTVRGRRSVQRGRARAR